MKFQKTSSVAKKDALVGTILLIIAIVVVVVMGTNGAILK
jgi:hypothetical protein